ncbi:MAG TPA: sigma 54-interacting transcriptional regulator [Planctomycetota bacterium]|jgi:DNA-binding NtrC family response regulator|nr:MAG: Transcriptional regulatory protein ZraR [Planctomycetes bacterium ADurb.Bin069]HNS00653.1 sigma 54-interacting transcriptional regulator [Planctomycetota bacterium]HNU26546.1 sigma 54-interacting transcriptional regulator [Planctomycetota bacterium]HOE30768.1 sigma 54-interacting transcriptional regulator [Planctomycetota bacterium]HOE87946.1 sigma 54-interacting transcriptional regulator [Planctomycetota bacterium]
MATPACTDRLPAHAGAIDSRTAPCPTASLPTQACLAHAPYQPTLSCADDQRSLVELLDRLGVLSRLGRAIDDGAEILRRQADASGALIALAAPSGTYTVARAGEPFPARAHELAGKALLRGVARDGDLRAALLRGGQPCQWFLITKHNRGPERTPSAAPRLDFLDCALALYAAAFADGAGAPPQDDLPLSPRHRRIQALFPHIVTRTPEMLEILGLLELFAPTDYPILIQGESGTGKELVARAAHLRSRRAAGPYISENCAAVPESLQESEFFGVARGAYTGATSDRPGLFRLADGGTLFLDEIGEMPPMLQKKLLRVLQERELRPVGSRTIERIDVRCIAATNRPLEELVASGIFRSDLYFRLNTVMLHLPPLRDRRDDILMLAHHFLAHGAAFHDAAEPPSLSLEAAAALREYAWPGNIRELKNEIQRAVVLARGDAIMPAHLSAHITGPRRRTFAQRFLHGELNLPQYERKAVGGVIQSTLAAVNGNKSACARLLGIPKTSLYRRMQRYGIPDPETSAPPALRPQGLPRRSAGDF